MGDALYAPKTLSFGSTTCNFNACRASILTARLFGPLKGRPSHDISVGLFGGPTAWDARLLNGTTAPTAPSWLPVLPNGSLPLKLSLARPSQKFCRLKVAPIIGGVLRPVTRRL